MASADEEGLVLLRESSRRRFEGLGTIQALCAATLDIDELGRHTWQLAAAQGWTALGVPEDQGGLGLDEAHLCVLGEEIGRALASGPFTVNLALLPALARHPAAAKFARTTLPAIASGEMVCTLAVRGRAPADGVAHALAIAHHSLATHLLLIDIARGPGTRCRIEVKLLERQTWQAQIRQVEPLDPASPMALLEGDLAGQEAVAQFEFECDIDEFDLLLRPARLFAAAQAIGLSESAFDHAVGYARLRRQFDKVIGSFQAIQHPLADAHIEIVSARALLDSAMAAEDGSALEAHVDAHLAWFRARKAAINVSQRCIQLHGAIGFCWEHPAHLFLKRAHFLSQSFIGVSASESFLARMLLGNAPQLLRH